MEFYYNRRKVEVKQWEGQQLGSILSVDTETDFVPFHTIAELATFQVFNGKTVYWVDESQVSRFLDQHRESAMIFHNAPFDLDVIAEHIHVKQWIYDVVDRNKVFDTAILYKLWHLAHVGFVPFKSSLDHLSRTLIGETLVKDDSVRCNFMQFKGKPISEIPEEFVEYGSKDVVATWDAYFVLTSRIKKYDTMGTLLSHHIQIKGAVALDHIYKNGIGFDLRERDKWLKKVDSELEKESDILASWGWVRGVKGLKERYENIISHIGLLNILPRTEDGSVSSKREDLEKYNDIPFISSYLRFHELEKASSFVRDICTERVHPRYNILVNTGRTSCSKPNFQQLPKMGGVREMFRAREGYTFGIVDYNAIELSTLAQVTYDRYNYSVMREKINEGADLHKYYASVMHNCDIRDVTKQWRQEAKAANFGFPGGLGIDTFIEFSRGYGLALSPEVAQDMKDTWFNAFPEMGEYMQGEQGGVYTLTGRYRGNTTFCAEKNTPFQGLAADRHKISLYELDKAGFKIVGQVHDEVLCEFPKSMAEEKLKEMEEIMSKGMKSVVPDVKVGVEGMLSEVYTK